MTAWLDRLVSWLDRSATRRNILLILAVYVVINAAVLPLAQARIEAASGGIGPLDLQPWYSPAEAYTRLAAYGSDGRLFYTIVELTADLVYPAVYGLFFALAIVYFFRRVLPAGHAAFRLALLPLLGTLLDYLENAGIVTMLLSYPARLDGVALVSGVLTGLKWLMAVASLLVLIVAVVAVFRRRFGRGGTTPAA